MLELVGPTGVSGHIINLAKQLSSLQSGLLSSYILVILIGGLVLLSVLL